MQQPDAGVDINQLFPYLSIGNSEQFVKHLFSPWLNNRKPLEPQRPEYAQIWSDIKDNYGKYKKILSYIKTILTHHLLSVTDVRTSSEYPEYTLSPDSLNALMNLSFVALASELGDRDLADTKKEDIGIRHLSVILPLVKAHTLITVIENIQKALPSFIKSNVKDPTASYIAELEHEVRSQINEALSRIDQLESYSDPFLGEKYYVADYNLFIAALYSSLADNES